MDIRGLIVDDESRSRALLKGLCEQYCEGLVIDGMVASVSEAIKKIEESPPDLVFLDIQMPVQNGFGLLEYFEDALPFEVIFTTAYDQYAIKAFQFTAADYLLKPINVDELTDAVARVRQRLNQQHAPTHLTSLKKQLGQKGFDKIALTTAEGFTFVNISDIIRFEAEGNYTKIHVADSSTHLVTKVLKHYDELLANRNFFRTHKSHLINLEYVRRFVKGRQGVVEMVDGTAVEVSSRKKDGLLGRLGDQTTNSGGG